MNPEPSEARYRPIRKEADLDHEIKRLVAQMGLQGFHVPDSRGMSPGFPDWVIIGPGGLIFRECKMADGQMSSSQTRLRYLLISIGQDYSVWRPADLYSGLIESELRLLTPRE
jgi:hypothetical protein